jgi:phage protein D
VMDLEERNDGFENQPDSVIVTRILTSRYARYGVVPIVTPTTDVPIEVERVPSQQETDLALLERMAERNGFVFYIEPVTLGVNRAHWGPEDRAGAPQPALSQDMGSATNLRSLDFSHDSLQPVATEGVVVEPFLKLSIPIPPLPSLKLPPLAAAPARAVRKAKARDSANQNPLRAATSAVAAATNTGDAVSGDGEVDTVKYGHILRARRLVGVRGAGRSYDGFYTVQAVTHTLARGEYQQRFRISREGTGTTTPVVLP